MKFKNKEDLPYFPFYAGFRDDKRIKRVRKQLGVEGYGIYVMILEVLRTSEDFRYPYEDIDLLADEIGTSPEKVLGVVKGFKLFETVDEVFFSTDLISSLQPLLESRYRAKISGIKGNLIKYQGYTKEDLALFSDQELISLNETKSRGAIGGRSGGDRVPIASKSKSKSKKKNNICSNSSNVHTMEIELKEPQKKVAPYPEDFEKLWEVYERRGVKKKALAEWKKLSAENKVQAMQSVESYKKEQPEAQYRKHLHLYLRDEVFLDVLERKDNDIATGQELDPEEGIKRREKIREQMRKKLESVENGKQN